ncbi:MAG: hypothetical protein JXA11_02285 [Phycisphaerae bacterium]|nr:hypothetical protein [Phycisphaerae bacterium]
MAALPFSFAQAESKREEQQEQLEWRRNAVRRHGWFLENAKTRLTPPSCQEVQLQEYQQAATKLEEVFEANKSDEDIDAAFKAVDQKLSLLETTVRREALAFCLLEQLEASRDILPLVKDAETRDKYTSSLNAIQDGLKNIFADNASDEVVDQNLAALRAKLRAVQNEMYKTAGWLPGVSSVSIGRFGFKLSDGLLCENVSFETVETSEELKKLGRVGYDDRKISPLGCDISFPETRISLSVGPRGVKNVSARKQDVNWIGKTIAISTPEHPNLGVVRTTLQRPATRFTFASPSVDCPLRDVDSAQSSVQYLSNGGDWKKIPLSQNATIEGKDLQKPWIALDLADGKPTRPDKQGQHILIVIQLQKRLREIVVSPEMLTFVGEKGPFGDMWLYRPLGIQRPKVVNVSKELTQKIDELASLNLAWPMECDEIFNVDSEGKLVNIRNELKCEMLQDDWGTKPTIATAVPNILMLAKRYDVPGVTIDEKVKNWDLPTIIGPYGTVEGATLNYTIPVPPLYHHAFFMVDKPGQDKWTKRINESVRYYGREWISIGDVVFRGIAFFWPSRDYFNDENQAIVEKASRLTSGFIKPDVYWNRLKWRNITMTDVWYCYDYPYKHYRDRTIADAGWGNALGMYGLDKWAAYSGNWDELDAAWPDVWAMMEHFKKTHDWGWMADSITEFGEGAAIDCLATSHAAMVAMARMARELNRPVDAATAAYLSAKTALTHTTRFAFLEYIQKYNLWHDDSVGRGTVNGFQETSTWIHPANCPPWWGVCSLSGFGAELENFDAMLLYVKPERIKKWWEMVTSIYPDWYDRKKKYPAGTIYGGNSNFITHPAIYLEFRLGANDAQLEKYIEAAGFSDGKEQNVNVYGEIANRACPVQIASWGRCTHEKAKFDPKTRTARVTFLNPTKTPQPVTFRCEVYPTDVQLGDKSVQPTTSTDVWKLKLLHLNIPPGKHVVQLHLP